MKGILLKEPLFHQTVKGLKTETRRTIKTDPKNEFLRIETPVSITTGFRNEKPIEKEYPLGAIFSGVFYNNHLGYFDECIIPPRYNIGEVVYIKEPIHKNELGHIIYKYDCSKEERKLLSWSNKLFMAAKDARHHIKILDIEVERIYDISAASVKAEGLDLSFKLPDLEFYANKIAPDLSPGDFNDWHLSFFYLFKKINPKTPLNSWVWVYKYELIKL